MNCVSAWRPSTGPAERSVGADRGLTLPELLVCVVVVGVLATLVTLSVRSTSRSASEVACKADRRTVEQAVARSQERGGAELSIARLASDGFLRAPSEHHLVLASGEVVARPGGLCDDYPGVRSPPNHPASGGPDATGPMGATAEALEVTLTWTGNADLDLWVQTPAGEIVGWTGPAGDGGALDRDVVPPAPDAYGPHVERIRWPPGAATFGVYLAWVRYESAGWGPQSTEGYAITVRDGDTALAATSGEIGAPGTASAAVVALLSA